MGINRASFAKEESQDIMLKIHCATHSRVYLTGNFQDGQTLPHWMAFSMSSLLYSLQKLSEAEYSWTSQNHCRLSSLRLGQGWVSKKDLHGPDNHDDLITHLEPDILECEVRWALRNINMNKASEGDGITVELVQILKDNAVKVLPSMCQQIWKTQQWPPAWKMSVFIPIPKKDNAKECSNYRTTALISHTSWGRKWQPSPVFLPGESQGWGSPVGCRLWGCTESDTTEAT